MSKRSYRLGRRAESQQTTRRRIVEATVHLHETLGPRATTISAIAERAGVQRLTVYRHFPDDVALFHACSSHWMAHHPFPDRQLWRPHGDWRARCEAAFAAVYAYYRRNRGMLASVLRDADLPAMRDPMRTIQDYFATVRDDLLEVAEPALADDRRFGATLEHALGFATWQSLAERLSDAEMADLALAWLAGVAAAVSRPAGRASRSRRASG